MEGQGSYTLPTGTEYRGALRDGMFDGEGELLFPNGGTYRAVWHRGVPTQVSRAGRGGPSPPRGASAEGERPRCREGFWGEIWGFPSQSNFRSPRRCLAPERVRGRLLEARCPADAVPKAVGARADPCAGSAPLTCGFGSGNANLARTPSIHHVY